MWSRDELLDPTKFTREDLATIILTIQRTDRQMFAATALGALIQSGGQFRQSDQILVNEAVELADLLLSTLKP